MASLAILGRSGSAPNWRIVDVGEAGDVRQRVSTHDRADCWRRQNHAELTSAALYCDERTRLAVESRVRTFFKPPCGDR